MRVGIFGGTFDPVHLGHLILAEQCREQAHLDQVWFVPAARPPHKPDQPVTTFHQRVEMLALAISGNPAFRISEIERDRPGPSYTVDTLAQILQENPGTDLYLILGGDSVRDFPTWYQPRKILEMASILVVPRQGGTLPTDAEFCASLGVDTALVRLQKIEMPWVTISSSDLRKRWSQSRSVRYMVPRAIEAYAEDKGLYR